MTFYYTKIKPVFSCLQTLNFDSEGSEDEQKKIKDESETSDSSEDEEIKVEEKKEGETAVEMVNVDHKDMAEIRKPRRKRFIPKYDVEGVYKIVLGEEAQLQIEMLVGTHVSAQFPWKLVSRDKILDCIAAGGELSEFFRLKQQLEKYPEPEVLMGYIVDESKDEDEFYICCTVEAKTHCKEQSDKFIHRQEKKLEKSINKKPRPWPCLGSDEEIKSLTPINLRPLMELEIKAKFPTVYQPERFNVRDANDVRDGYIELTPYRQKFNNVVMRRIDCSSQIAPVQVDRDAQTELRYPQNMWTQSIADALGTIPSFEGGGGDTKKDDAAKNLDEIGEDDISDDDEDFEEKEELIDKDTLERYTKAFKRLKRHSYIDLFKDFLSKAGPMMNSVVDLNTVMDIYRDDYLKLQTKQTVGIDGSMKFEEYICFTDIRAKDKSISAAVFHPMWSGIVAISYSDDSPATVRNIGPRPDPVSRAVYGLNPVLIWSHVDSLHPKLLLEAPREVKALNFCPFEENLLVGGCINGQIIVWDLTNKLENVEVIEVLSETRERYRIAMQAHMGWMKNVHDPTVVQATALTNLMTSHYSTVTAIKWIPSSCVVTPTGKLIPNEESYKSVIFLTGSEDGHILIWNMDIKNISFFEAKKMKKSKRVLRRPSGLSVNVSPYKVLDRNLSPCYKINLGIAGHPELIPVGGIGTRTPTVTYTYTPKNTGSGRKYYTCSVSSTPTPEDLIKIIYIGSQHGEIIRLSWEGHDFNTGEVVNSEYSDITFRCGLHDGNITCIQKNPFIPSLALSTGGKIFALWSDKLIGRPLLWKKRPNQLTSMKWSMDKPSLFFISNTNGDIEAWDILVRSDQPITVQTVSGNKLTYVSVHSIPVPKSILGVSDDNASFQMLLCPQMFVVRNPEHYIQRVEKMIARELKVMQSFLSWQEQWIKNNPEVLQEIKRKEAASMIEKEEERKRLREEEEARLEAEAEARRIAKARIIGPEEKWRMIVQKLIEKTIAVKKRINRAQLIEQEKPLRELESQRLEKEKRMYEIMKNQQTIFNNTVAILFPEAVQKEARPKKTLLGDNKELLKKTYLEEYEKIKKEAWTMIKENPYKIEFSWDATLAEGKERRQALNSHEAYVAMHRTRLETESFEGLSKAKTAKEEPKNVVFGAKPAEAAQPEATDENEGNKGIELPEGGEKPGGNEEPVKE